MKTFSLSLCLAAACLVSCTLPPPVNRIADFSAAIGSIPEGWKDETVVILSDTVDLNLKVSRGALLHGTSGSEVKQTSDPNFATRRECTWLYVNRRNPNVLEQWSVS